MARRPEFPANVMTREELKQLQRSLSLPSPYAIRDKYTCNAGGMPIAGRSGADAAHHAGARDALEGLVEVAEMIIADRWPSFQNRLISPSVHHRIVFDISRRDQYR